MCERERERLREKKRERERERDFVVVGGGGGGVREFECERQKLQKRQALVQRGEREGWERQERRRCPTLKRKTSMGSS